jgi:sortase (surface protein transpeptidase)
VATGAPSTAAAGGGASTASPTAADDPVRLRIPDIGVWAPVVPLDLDAHGQLEPTPKFTEVGWNHAGPEPGEDGVAVIAGHVDSKTGPAVFYRLGDLRPGAAVLVEEADGHTARFVVDRIARYPKNAFPDAEVYRSGSGAQLRLITCGGAFNRSTGHYVDNIVAFAHLV